jgi:hypothetical protein
VDVCRRRLAVIAVVLVPTLQVALEMQVDRALFPQRFDYRRRLRSSRVAHPHPRPAGPRETPG